MLDCLTRWHLGGAEWLRGRLAEAERALVSSIAGWRAAGDPILPAWSSEHLGQVQRAQGRLDAALGTYREALEMAAEPGGPALQAAGPALVGIAAVLYERGELEAALGHASEGIALCRQLGYSLPLVGAWPP